MVLELATAAGVASILGFLLSAIVTINNQADVAVANVAGCRPLACVVKHLDSVLQELVDKVEFLAGAPLRALRSALESIKDSLREVNTVMLECTKGGVMKNFFSADGLQVRLAAAASNLGLSMHSLSHVGVIMQIESFILKRHEKDGWGEVHCPEDGKAMLRFHDISSAVGVKLVGIGYSRPSHLGLMTEERVKALGLLALESDNLLKVIRSHAAGELRAVAVMGLPVGGGGGGGGGGGASAAGKADSGCATLYDAAQHGNLALVRALLRQGAVVDESNKVGKTPLWGAAAAGHKAMVLELLGYGADVDAPDQAGETPLVVAARNNHKGVVKLLLSRGANRHLENNEGRTALSYAKGVNANSALAKLLQVPDGPWDLGWLCGLGSTLSPKASASKKSRVRGGSRWLNRTVTEVQQTGGMQSVVNPMAAPPPDPKLGRGNVKTVGLLALLALGLAVAVLL